MSKTKIFRYRSFFLIHNSGIAFTAIGQKDRWIYQLPSLFSKIRSLFLKIRSLFPMAYAIGLRCCDHGGRVMSWRKDICWGFWDNLDSRWDGAGDGPNEYHQISFAEYFKWQK